MFYLIRHGKTDYSERNRKIYQGFGVNLAPLSAVGVQEIKNTAKDIRLQDVNIILSSPYTRALQTAAILSKELHIDIIVETDLHEWMANKNFIYESDEQAEHHYKEFVDSSGVYLDGIEREWEDIQTLKGRFIAVLNKYKQYNNVIVACHGMLIQSISGGYHPKNGEIVELDLNRAL
jgi:Fructose-2,6-bisphosphatase